MKTEHFLSSIKFVKFFSKYHVCCTMSIISIFSQNFITVMIIIFIPFISVSLSSLSSNSFVYSSLVPSHRQRSVHFNPNAEHGQLPSHNRVQLHSTVSIKYCIKSVRFCSFSSPHFLAFGLNTGKCGPKKLRTWTLLM